MINRNPKTLGNVKKKVDFMLKYVDIFPALAYFV